MCDVLVALPDATASGNVVFGKNSDRPADECQPLYYSSGGRRDPGSKIHCSYVTVPEVEHVLATFGCRPYWCWGYETGMNEAGVVGGNVAVFTKGHGLAKDQESLGLTGMDLLRLSLERARNAEEAVGVIVGLLEQYGQWGSAVQGKKHEAGGYDNAFLLADRKEAWVLETSDRRWVAERITKGVRSLSNQLSIRTQWAKSSRDLRDFARSQGWWTPNAEFDFALVYADHCNYARQVSHIRWKRSGQLLLQHQGQVNAAAMMRFLRDHYEDTFLEGPQFHAFLPDFLTLCMHDSPAGFTWGNTATSVVVELDPNDPAPPPFWLCYLPPCTGIYSAYYLGATVPETVAAAGTAGVEVRPAAEAPRDEFSESSLWWRFNRLVEEVAKDPRRRQAELRSVFDPIEKHHLAQVGQLLVQPTEARQQAFRRWIPEQVSEVMVALVDLEKRWQVAQPAVARGATKP